MRSRRRASCLRVFLFTRNGLSQQEHNNTAKHNTTMKTTATSNESGLVLSRNRSDRDRRWNDLPVKETLCDRSTGKISSFLSSQLGHNCQLGCTISQSTLPEQRRHRVKFEHSLDLLPRIVDSRDRREKKAGRFAIFRGYTVSGQCVNTDNLKLVS